MLKIENLKVSYGGIEAVKGISFSVEQGQIVTLIGANGAGKSTTLRTVVGPVSYTHLGPKDRDAEFVSWGFHLPLASS